MSRQRTGPLLALVAAGVLASACGSSSSLHPTSRAAISPAVPLPGVPAADQARVAHRFALAYVEYLGGSTSVALPAATQQVAEKVRAAGPIPASVLHGRLTLAGLRPATGQPGVWVISARDHRHTFYASITVRDAASTVLLVGIEPPDVEQSTVPGVRQPGPPPGSAAVLASARAFLRGYVPFAYGHGPLAAVSDLTARLRTQLQAPGRGPAPALSTLHPRVTELGVLRKAASWVVKPVIADGNNVYQLLLTLTRQRGRWLVANVQYAQ